MLHAPCVCNLPFPFIPSICHLPPLFPHIGPPLLPAAYPLIPFPPPHSPLPSSAAAPYFSLFFNPFRSINSPTQSNTHHPGAQFSAQMNSLEEGNGGGGANKGGAFLRRRVAKSSDELKRNNNRLKRAIALPFVARIKTTAIMDPGGGEEFIGYGGRIREGQQRVLPIYELKIRSGEASSASLRIASAQPGEPQIVRCTIPSDSRRAFIPGTLSLTKDGRKVGQYEENGNSISYEFAPWADDAIGASATAKRGGGGGGGQMQTSHFGSPGHHHHQGGRRIVRRRQKKEEKKHQQRRKKKIPQKPILFHCSASVFPLEAQKRGRLPLANTHQRTLKMTPWQGKMQSVSDCPMPEAEGFCRNGGKCVQMEPDGARYCLCPNNFIGRYCERLSPGLIGTMPLSAFCLSFVGLLLLLLVLLLSALLAKEKCVSRRIRKASKTIKAVAVRLNEEESADTPLEDLYDTADGVRRGSPPSSANTMSSPSPSPSRIPRLYSAPLKKQQNAGADNNGGGYDNLEKLREEIQRQKAGLEERRAASRLEGENFPTERELGRSPDMDSLPSNAAPSPPKKSAYMNLLGDLP